MQENDKSEVARLMRQIEQEYEAAQRGLYGFASGAARHEFINAKVENIGRCHEHLKTLVGEQEATKALAQALEQAGNAVPPEKEAAQ
jgi:hypothetical protein